MVSEYTAIMPFKQEACVTVKHAKPGYYVMRFALI